MHAAHTAGLNASQRCLAGSRAKLALNTVVVAAPGSPPAALYDLLRDVQQVPDIVWPPSQFGKITVELGVGVWRFPTPNYVSPCEGELAPHRMTSRWGQPGAAGRRGSGPALMSLSVPLTLSQCPPR